jgi:hypothetical protein
MLIMTINGRTMDIRALRKKPRAKEKKELFTLQMKEIARFTHIQPDIQSV